MIHLKENLYIDKIYLKKMIELNIEMMNQSLSTILSFNVKHNPLNYNIEHNPLNYNIEHNRLNYELILEENKIINAKIYQDILKTMDNDKPYFYILKDTLELLERENNKALFEEYINLKEVDIIINRKIDPFFDNDNKLDDCFIFGKNKNDFYFYIELRKEESKEGKVTNKILEMVVCKEQERLLDFMANKFNFVNEITDIKIQLFYNYLNKSVENKKIKNKVKL